jgi:hypothetical protein
MHISIGSASQSGMCSAGMQLAHLRAQLAATLQEAHALQDQLYAAQQVCMWMRLTD